LAKRRDFSAVGKDGSCTTTRSSKHWQANFGSSKIAPRFHSIQQLFTAMKISRIWFGVGLIGVAAISYAAWDEWNREPDLPGPLKIQGGVIDKENFMLRRAEQTALKRGIDSEKDVLYSPLWRQQAIAAMDELAARAPLVGGPWRELGPAPTPNGQTVGTVTPVSGRVISIAVHPTNADIVYVGTASGGLYRSLDGGSSWVPLMDRALS
jgi:hypothetical protein